MSNPVVSAKVKAGLSIGAISALDDIACERSRQMLTEGHTLRHDDGYAEGELARAACCYAIEAHRETIGGPICWPWPALWWKPKSPRQNLVRAGALIVAEIERIDRLSQQRGMCHGR